MVARPQRLGAALHRRRRTGGQRAGTLVRPALGVACYLNASLRVTLGVHRHGAAVDVTRPSAASVIGLAAANCGAVGRVLLDRGGTVVRARPDFGGDDASGSAPSPVPAFPGHLA